MRTILALDESTSTDRYRALQSQFMTYEQLILGEREQYEFDAATESAAKILSEDNNHG